MSNRAWMPLGIDDYLADTGHLTPAEHGAYLLLIMHYWKHDGLPKEERLIARITRMTQEQWAESRDVLAEFFADGWSHKRIDEELAKAEAIIEKRKAAANSRYQASKSTAHADQEHSKSTDTGVPPRTLVPSSSLRSDDTREPSPRSLLETVLDAERAAAVVKHRKACRKPLTAHAAKLLAGKFAKCAAPNAAADAMVANGWQGFEPEWLEHRLPRGSPVTAKRTPLDAVNELLGKMTDADNQHDQGDGPTQPLALGFSGTAQH